MTLITTNLYEEKDGTMVAVVLEDGVCANYIPCPEICTLEADSFLEEASLGFPEAIPYEFDLMVGKTMEQAAAQADLECTLIARIGQEIRLYPQRMSPENQELCQMDLGEDAWQELLDRASGGEPVQVEL